MSGRAAALAGVPVLPDRGEARSWLTEELARREYADARPDLLEQALRWLFDQVAALSIPRGPGGAIGTAVVLLLVGVLVALAVGVGGPVLRNRRRARADAVFGSTVRSAGEHRDAADRAAQAGRWDEAVTERFRAVVRALEERTVLDPRPGRTAGEAASEAAPAFAALGPELAAGARAFEDVRYGERPGTPDADQQLRRLDRDLAAARPALPGAAAAAPA